MSGSLPHMAKPITAATATPQRQVRMAADRLDVVVIGDEEFRDQIGAPDQQRQ
jgi:hypothetical protein